MSEFKDKVVIVTGASSGIGRATGVLFAEKGAKVVLVGRNKEKLAITEKECIAASKKENILVVTADVTKLDELKKIVDETVKAFKQIDVLVNNAGATKPDTITNATPKGFEEMMNLNARAPLFLTQYCVPYLTETKGSIVNVSSVGSLIGLSSSISYTMAKAAVNQLTRSACAEFGSKGIRVNCVNPGLISTDFGEAAGYSPEAYEGLKSMFVKRTPAGRVGEGGDIAEVILFLASSKTYVHGVNLVADGGILETMQ